MYFIANFIAIIVQHIVGLKIKCTTWTARDIQRVPRNTRGTCTRKNFKAVFLVSYPTYMCMPICWPTWRLGTQKRMPGGRWCPAPLGERGVVNQLQQITIYSCLSGSRREWKDWHRTYLMSNILIFKLLVATPLRWGAVVHWLFIYTTVNYRLWLVILYWLSKSVMFLGLISTHL